MWTPQGPSSRPNSRAPWTGSRKCFGRGEENDEDLRTAHASDLVVAAETLFCLYGPRSYQYFCRRLSHRLLGDASSSFPGISGLCVVSGNSEISTGYPLPCGSSGLRTISHHHLVSPDA